MKGELLSKGVGQIVSAMWVWLRGLLGGGVGGVCGGGWRKKKKKGGGAPEKLVIKSWGGRGVGGVLAKTYVQGDFWETGKEQPHGLWIGSKIRKILTSVLDLAAATHLGIS